MFDKLDVELPEWQNLLSPPLNPNAGIRLHWLHFLLATCSFNLLQILTFYNGIANRGKMVKPLFIDKIVDNGQIIYNATPKNFAG